MEFPFVPPDQLADAIERISNTNNGMTILILVVVFGFLMLGGLIVWGWNRRADKQLEREQSNQEFQQKAFAGLGKSFERIAQVQEDAALQRKSDAQVQAGIVEALGELALSLNTFRTQQLVNVKTLGRLEENQTALQTTFNDTITGITGDLQEVKTAVGELTKEITLRGLDKIEILLRKADEIITSVETINTTVHQIKDKVDTQEIATINVDEMKVDKE